VARIGAGGGGGGYKCIEDFVIKPVGRKPLGRTLA
jgi:hypothetical protein